MRLTRILLAPALAIAIVAGACSTSWIQTAEQYIAILVPAVQDVIGILEIAGVAGVAATDTNAVSKYAAQATTDLQSIGTLLTQYNSANATTTAQKMAALATDAKSNLNLILPALHVTDANTVTKVTAAVNLAVNTIGEIEALVPVSPSTSPTLARGALNPPKPSVLQQQFNQIFAK